MYKVLQGTPTMGTSLHQCTPLQSIIVLWSLLHTLLLGATLGTLLPVGFQGFSGLLQGGRGAGKGMIRGGLSVMWLWKRGIMMNLSTRGSLGGSRPWLLSLVLFFSSLSFAWLYGEQAGLTKLRLLWRYAKFFHWAYWQYSLPLPIKMKMCSFIAWLCICFNCLPSLKYGKR